TVLPVPDAPIAADDNYITPRNTALVVTTSTQAVLNNDFDPDTRPYPHAAPWAAASGVDLLPIYAELAIPPAHGTIVFSPVGTFTYTPGTDYSGSDSFTYRAIDATGRQSEPATVQIRVNTPPVASADNY
ncbi:MAG: cadherin-like domain-containing protein, partial [Xanthomonadales bacterium]|nr:cadherin-like domain-containing protein [Xanthomonadales bacterium]